MGKKEERYNKRRLRKSYFTSTFSISLVLFVLGCGGLLFLGAKKLEKTVKEQLKIQIILSKDLDSTSKNTLLVQLREKKYSKQVVLISPKDARKEMQKAYGIDFMEVLEVNPFAPILELRITAAFANNDSIKAIENKLLKNYPKAITKIHKDTLVVEIVNKRLAKVELAITVISLLLLFIMLSLISNTIRLSMYTKRFLIKTMQLVGATPAFIRKPFLIQGIVQAVIGGFLAIAGLSVMLFFADNAEQHLVEKADLPFIGFLFLGIFLIGLFFTVLGTWMAVRKFLRLNINQLY